MGNDFIKAYEKLRPVLRDLYLYGCFGRGDFPQRQISARKYDNEKRKIVHFLPQPHVRQERAGRKVYVRLLGDMFHVKGNYLKDSYAIKKIANADAALYIKLFCLLADGQGKSLEQLVEGLEQLEEQRAQREPDSAAQEVPLPLFVYRKLNRLCSAGLVATLLRDGARLYALPADPFADFSAEELAALAGAVQFFAGVEPLAVPGWGLLAMLRLYAAGRGWTLPAEDCFLLRGAHFEQILDDEVLADLLAALRRPAVIRFEYCRFHRIWDGEPAEWRTVPELVPLRILSDDRYGRRSLLAAPLADLTRLQVFRLDRMRQVKLCQPAPQLVAADWQQRLQYSWGSSLGQGEPVLVELLFHVDAANQGRVLGRLAREGKWGTVAPLGEGVYRYTILVNDPRERKPWIRTFAGCVEVAASDRHSLKAELAAEWKELREYYGNLHGVS